MESIPRLLARYLDHYPAESDKLCRFVRLVEETVHFADLIARTNFTGHATASGFVVSHDHSAVLLIHHRRLEMFLQPGGHLDHDDASPLDGARREVREETGLDGLHYLPAFADVEIPFDIDSHYIPPNPRKGEPEHWHHDFRYVLQCPAASETLTLAPDEVAEARWIPLRELGDYPTLSEVATKLRALVASR